MLREAPNFCIIFAKTSRGYLGPLKMDFFDFNGKYVYILVDNYHFWGKIQNLGRSMHTYKIIALLLMFLCVGKRESETILPAEYLT